MSSSKEPLAYWRGLYELLSGLKPARTEEYLKGELKKIEDQLLHGLCYFKTLSKDQSTEEEAVKRSKDSKLNSLVKRLSSILRLEPTQTWEILSNYLLYAFRGPAESLKRILVSESKVNAVMQDVFCFYYRERMFLLKSLTVIITTQSGSGHNKNYEDLLKKIKFESLYGSLVRQLESVRKAEPPETNNPSGIVQSQLVNFWQEHNLLEQLELVKLLILMTPKIDVSMERMDKILTGIQKTSSAKRTGALNKNDGGRQALLRSIWDLEIVHFIQLLSLDKLPGESIWKNEDLFQRMDESIRQNVQYEGASALLVSWLLVTYLCPFGPKYTSGLQSLGAAVKQMCPWDYFDRVLTSQTIQDEPPLSKLVNKAIYEVVYLTVSNFGLEFVRDEPGIYKLTSSLVKDDDVTTTLWALKDEGLIQILEEAERWFPAVWQPALDIYASLASRGKFNCSQVLERLEGNLKYCQKQTEDLDLTVASGNVFQSRHSIQPLTVFPDVTIPPKTQCTISQGDCTFIHWDVSLPFWLVMLNDIKVLQIQMVRTPDYVDQEIQERVIGLLKFSKEVLKNAFVITNDMILAFEEVFNIVSKCASGRGSKGEVDLLSACLEVSAHLVPLFPLDVLTVFSSLKFLPEIDHVVMDHVKCVQGHHYRGSYVKTLLELVEIKNGRFPLLISYLQFVHALFKVDETRVSWLALSGLLFVLKDVLPHYRTWYFTDETERVEIGWLAIRLLHASLNGAQEDLTVPQQPQETSSDATSSPAPCYDPTFSLMANTCLYSLLNKDAGTTLIRSVATGEQRLFDMVEKFPSWKSGRAASLVSTVHYALSVLNRIILYKGVQQDPGKLSPTEEEIYKEPKDTDRYHCVLNVASYLHHSFNPKLRVLACRLLTRFADNTRLSLMLCTGLEPYTIRDMFLQPLYSECESSQLKVAILQFIAKCIHKQASLAEAFLNVLELKECISSGEEQEGVTSGVLTFALAVIDGMESSSMTDPVYHATVQLLHALWLEQCSVVLSYLRMRKGFWESLCRPLFSEPRDDVPVYTSILNILSTEFYWYGKEVHSNLDDSMKKFLSEDSEYLLKWSLLCTNPTGQSVAAAKKRESQSEELVVAWRELVITVAKFLPDLVADRHKEMLALHLLTGLSAEMASLLNMNTIIVLAEAYIMLITIWKENCCQNKKEVAVTQMVRVLAQLSQHYTYIHPKAITAVLALSGRLLDTGPQVIPQKNDAEVLMKSVCDVVIREVDEFMENCMDRPKLDSPQREQQHLTLALCLALRLQSLIESDPSLVCTWIEVLRSAKLVQRLISATTAALRSQNEPKLCLFILEFLLALTDKECLFCHIDMFDLHYYIWENIPSCTTRFSTDKQTENSNVWKPVYCRGLDLVTFLLENNNYRIKTTTYDFIELHGEYLRELLTLLEVSNDEGDLDLLSSGLRLLYHIMQGTNFPLSVACAEATIELQCCVQSCLASVVNLLLHPNTLVSQFFNSSPRKQILPFDNKPLDQEVIRKVQKVQIKLVDIYCKCILALGKDSIDLSDVISSDRVGVPPWAMQPPINHSPNQDFSTILNAINLFTKVLTKNIRAATPVTGATDDLTMALSKLSEVDHDDIRYALEISAHFLISHILLIAVDDRLTFRQKQLFTRDLSSEVNILLEYARRVSVDPTLHRLQVSSLCKEDEDLLESPSKSNPLLWPSPPASKNPCGIDDNTLDGINYLDSEKDSSCIESTTPTQSASLPMDFLAFAAQVFQLVFKMSEK